MTPKLKPGRRYADVRKNAKSSETPTPVSLKPTLILYSNCLH